MKKLTITMLETVNIVAWYNQLGANKLGELEFKIRWALKKAINKLLPDAQEFEKMRDEEIKHLQEDWFTDEKSDEYMETVVDENGENVLDDQGNVQTRPMRKIKDKYADDYQKAIDELNGKLNEVLMERNTYEFNSADVDGFVDKLGDPEYLTFEDVEILDALLSDNGEE